MKSGRGHKQEMTRLIEKVCETDGWSAEIMPGGHWRVRGPNKVQITCASTPTDHRSVLNARSTLRRSGAVV